MALSFDNRYVQLPGRFYERVLPTPVSGPRWLARNHDLGRELGLDDEAFASEATLKALAGNGLLPGSEPIALAYAGHQFGGFVPRLGDGRAILLGEVRGPSGARVDVQLKGAGPTPFSRGGDGRAALGPVLREFLVSEAMHALGVPTTRALAAVATGERVYRDRALAGAVLTRVATSHLRVGTFAYFAARRDDDALARLVDLGLERHAPAARHGDGPAALRLFDAVLEGQAKLIAAWMSFGFVHGVMNTDNCAISGETLDYGPCAFLDDYIPSRHFSAIDHQGRYRYENQPRIGSWNLARFAETLLPLVGEGDEAVKALQPRLEQFSTRFEDHFTRRLATKLGLTGVDDALVDLASELLAMMTDGRSDFTLTFRALYEHAAGLGAGLSAHFADAPRFEAWQRRWRAAFDNDAAPRAERVEAMRRANPRFIARNHRVEEALSHAEEGNLGPFERLAAVLARPFDDQPEHDDLAAPPGSEQDEHRTFCGT
ncbi:MAG: YdiU family protein [Myxococcales bacterium]|nr:YdiU family protein [Myxococcales bacterium]